MPKMPKPRKDSAWSFISEFKPKSITVVSEDEASDMADFMICVFAEQKTTFTDNLFDFCSTPECGKKIQYRPHAPRGIKKICHECAAKLYKKDDDFHILISPRTAAEIVLYKSRQ